MRDTGRYDTVRVIQVSMGQSDDRSCGVAWFVATAWHQVIAETHARAPLETGGVLLGYWVHRRDERYDAPAPSWHSGAEVVITHALGPGPKAIHQRDAFSPDHEFHAHEVARIYAESGRMLTYLGDWHSHPTGTARLSRRDRTTLARIARSPDARAPHPLMLVIVADDERCSRLWIAHTPRIFGWTRMIGTGLLTPRIFVSES